MIKSACKNSLPEKNHKRLAELEAQKREVLRQMEEQKRKKASQMANKYQKEAIKEPPNIQMKKVEERPKVPKICRPENVTFQQAMLQAEERTKKWTDNIGRIPKKTSDCLINAKRKLSDETTQVVKRTKLENNFNGNSVNLHTEFNSKVDKKRPSSVISQSSTNNFVSEKLSKKSKLTQHIKSSCSGNEPERLSKQSKTMENVKQKVSINDLQSKVVKQQNFIGNNFNTNRSLSTQSKLQSTSRNELKVITDSNNNNELSLKEKCNTKSNRQNASINNFCEKTSQNRFSISEEVAARNGINRGITAQNAKFNSSKINKTTPVPNRSQVTASRGIVAQNGKCNNSKKVSSTDCYGEASQSLKGIAAQNSSYAMSKTPSFSNNASYKKQHVGIAAQNSTSFARGIAAQNVQVSRGIVAQTTGRGRVPVEVSNYDSDSDEYDSEMDDFIDDSGDYVTDEMRKEIHKSLHFDESKYAKVSKYDLCKGMDSKMEDIEKEEFRSYKLGKKEDDEEKIKLDKEKEMKIRKKKHNKSRGIESFF